MPSNSLDQIDFLVIGAGVVGLAIARQIALSGREVLIVDEEGLIGSATSARNSEVIHAGIYYPQGSLKAESCIRGRELLYSYCAANDVPHKNCGKIIVATDKDQIDRLDMIFSAALASGVNDLYPIDHAEMKRLEPALRGVCGLCSPSTGIIDSHSFMHCLLADIENNGGLLALKTIITRLDPVPGGIQVYVDGSDEPVLQAAHIINAAGHGAIPLANTIPALTQHVPPQYFAKGNYFTLSGRSPFSRLIYPVPVRGGLGTHLTLDLAGAMRFGPDVEWIDAIDYSVAPSRADQFYAAIRQYWPDLPDGSLFPAYCGIRPKITAPDEPAGDFIISAPQDHGISGLINLYGIESPGLTASLAIGEKVAAMI